MDFTGDCKPAIEHMLAKTFHYRVGLWDTSVVSLICLVRTLDTHICQIASMAIRHL